MSLTKPILYYFDGRGKAEIIRLILSASNIQWEDRKIQERESFLKLREEGKSLFGQIPVVEFEGKYLVQSSSIARFFSGRANFLGETEDERLKIDILFEGSRDFRGAFAVYAFQGYKEVLENIKANSLPRYLPVFEKVLKENGSNGYLIGSKLSLADIGLLECMLFLEELIGLDAIKEYPELKKFLVTMKSIKGIANYLVSPQRPRNNDDIYVQEVKRVTTA